MSETTSPLSKPLVPRREQATVKMLDVPPYDEHIGHSIRHVCIQPSKWLNSAVSIGRVFRTHYLNLLTKVLHMSSLSKSSCYRGVNFGRLIEPTNEADSSICRIVVIQILCAGGQCYLSVPRTHGTCPPLRMLVTSRSS